MVLLQLLKKALLLHGMVLLLLIEMAGNNAVAAAENGIDLAKNGAAAKDGWQ
jgi:hypothetical protein